MSNKKAAFHDLLKKKEIINKISEPVTPIPQITPPTETVTPPTGERPKKKATYELDLDLHTELKIHAARQNLKMVDIVEAAIREYLDKYK